jgi:hypothetical protein
LADDECQNGRAGESKKRRYNLEDRTARFGEAIIAFAKKIPVKAKELHLIFSAIYRGKKAV